MFSEHNYTIKCSDDDIPIYPTSNITRSGGTAILWKKNIDHMIEPVIDGCDRILAITVSNGNNPIIIINTYMPTLGCSSANYDETLSEIEEIIAKYKEYTVIWTGDINADTNRNQTSNDKKLIKFCQSQQLSVSLHTPDCPTFHHFNGTSKSRLDMFIQREHDEIIRRVTVHTRPPTNYSMHDAVTATINFQKQASTVPPKKTNNKVSPPVRWDKMDKVKYRENTQVRLNALKALITDLPAEVITQRLNDILVHSAQEACPPPPPRRKHTKYRWRSAFKPLAINVNSAYLEYRKSGMSAEKLTKLQTAKKILRKAQRQAAARRRNDINSGIIAACQRNDKAEFYQLIKKQRKTGKRSINIHFDHHTEDTTSNSWASYFRDLATPKYDESFDQDYERYLHINYLLQYITTDGDMLPPVSRQQIESLVRQLKSNKASDIFGITSEHIKLASGEAIDIIHHLVNLSVHNSKLPDICKIGSLCPVPKKAKPPKQPNSYRRITITAIIGKIIELHIIGHTKSILDPIQSPLQFGFSRGCSPIYAALLLTEIIADAKDSNQSLMITFMDTSKAFDVVHHNGMLNAIHEQGIRGNLWHTYNSMYTNIKSVVKWEDEVSKPFNETQGIRQGGSSSSDIYKAGKNKLLGQLTLASTNHIGHIHTGAVMVADDLALTSYQPYEMQTGLNIAQLDASKERYKFNCDKTKTITINSKHEPLLYLNEKELGTSKCEPHLGIYRNTLGTNSDTINNRISSARRAIMSLLGAGLRGYYGTGPEAGMLKYKTYVLPTLIYGLEALILTGAETKQLESFHRQNLRCILSLPCSTAVEAVHFLSGIPPIEAEIHIKSLNLFRNIVAADIPSPPALLIRDVVIRQATMKISGSSSWTVYIKNLLNKYNLPQIIDLIASTPTKTSWAKTTKSAVYDFWTTSLRETKHRKTSLEYLNTTLCQINKIHCIYKGITCPLTVKKAIIKSLLLVKRYPLAASKVAGSKQNSTCPLCNHEDETTTHFILYCSKLANTRAPYMRHIMDTIRTYKIEITPECIVQLILDSSNLPRPDPRHEDICRNFIFKIHNERAILLGGTSKYKTHKPHINKHNTSMKTTSKDKRRS